MAGLSIGEKGIDGAYPEVTNNYLVNNKLKEIADTIKNTDDDGKKN